jgi:hypothetical protein
MSKKIKGKHQQIYKSQLTDRNRNYHIHDNGGRPFKVVANNKGIHIYKVHISQNDDRTWPTLIQKFTKFISYWNGYDPAEGVHGNSILIQVNKHSYIFIGMKIFSFETDDEIIRYVSPLGNNDVPYPVAYSTDNVYFVLDNKMIRTKDLDIPITIANAEDLYGIFYGHIGNGKHRKYKMKKVKIIQKRL